MKRKDESVPNVAAIEKGRRNQRRLDGGDAAGACERATVLTFAASRIAAMIRRRPSGADGRRARDSRQARSVRREDADRRS